MRTSVRINIIIIILTYFIIHMKQVVKTSNSRPAIEIDEPLIEYIGVF